MPACGASQIAAAPNVWPHPAPIVNKGANALPEVPLETEIDQDRNFIRQSRKTALIGNPPERMAVML